MNKSLAQRDKEFVWHPFTQMKTAPEPLEIVKAKDAWLILENGRKLLDANSSWWTVLHGHCNSYIGKKIAEQYQEIDHVIFAGATHPKAVETAERIVGALPNHFSKVFFSDNGSTAVEVGIKMIYQYWHNKGGSKKRFLALEGAYHGDTFGAMSVSQRGYFNAPFEHLFFEVDYIPVPTDENYKEVLTKAEEILKTGEVAGFIFEPLVQGAAGMRIYKAEYLDQLIALAKKYEVLTIADEVMTGFYRTGTLFAINQLKEEPDIITMSKGITGGVLPIGLTVATQEIYDAFLDDATTKALLHGHSFTGNPISCAAVCANLDLLESEETNQKIETIVGWHKAYFNKIENHPMVDKIRQAGTILSINLKDEADNGYFSNIREIALNHFWDKNILLRPLGNVVFINAPYCISEGEMNSIYKAIDELLEKLSK